MCGIWGFFPDNGTIDLTDLGLVDQIMTLTSLRGKDSTGVAVIHEAKSKPRTIKMVGGPDFLLNSEAWAKVAEFAVKKGAAMFGHGRFGTKGAAIAKNAHPHTVDHITLVHNGTINFGLDEDHKSAETENDSLALTHAIAKEGLVEALYKVSGAYALIIHDAKQEKVFVVRNDERPLHMIRFLQSTIIMSESKALEYFQERNGSYAKADIHFFPKNVIYSYDLKTGKLDKSNDLVEKLAKKYTAPAYVPPTTTGWNTYTGGTGGTAKPNTRITRRFPNGHDLMLLECKKMSKGTDFRLTFMDEANHTVLSYTRFDQKDKIGQTAVCGEINVTRTHGGEEFQFTTFKDLKWPEIKTTAPEKKEEDPAAPVRFRNNVAVNRSEATRILNKHDCFLCQGVVRESEIPETILMSDKKLICCDCINQGKHYSYGFGQ